MSVQTKQTFYSIFEYFRKEDRTFCLFKFVRRCLLKQNQQIKVNRDCKMFKYLDTFLVCNLLEETFSFYDLKNLFMLKVVDTIRSRMNISDSNKSSEQQYQSFISSLG